MEQEGRGGNAGKMVKLAHQSAACSLRSASRVRLQAGCVQPLGGFWRSSGSASCKQPGLPTAHRTSWNPARLPLQGVLALPLVVEGGSGHPLAPTRCRRVDLIPLQTGLLAACRSGSSFWILQAHLRAGRKAGSPVPRANVQEQRRGCPQDGTRDRCCPY